MKLNKKYLMSFLVLAGGLGLAGISARDAQAAVLTGQVDTSGNITGTAGATYYDTSDWQDMMDTYKDVNPDAASNNTIYFNVTADVQGSKNIGGYNYSSTTNNNNGASIIEGKSLSINGNGHMLYLDDDSDPTTPAKSSGVFDGKGAGNIRGPFRVPNGVGNDTKLTIENANITNNITGGIFQAVGNTSEATFLYRNVTVTNGSNYGAQPIRNDRGKILFEGNNTFNILQNQDFNSVGLYGADNQGEWIQGGAWVEVVSGTTKLNQNWWSDQPFYTYNNTSHTMKVDKYAQLVWNLNDTYCMYYDDGNKGPMVWDIGDNASFDIKGTKDTASHYGNWFYDVANSSWTVNVGEKSRLSVTTGGGNINTNGFNGGPVNWNVGKDSTVLLNNLKSGNLIAGAPGAGSGIVLNDPAVFTLNTVGGSVFNSNLGNRFPIEINGNGLRTHMSEKEWNFTNLDDLNSPNKLTLDQTNQDIWYRANTGTITGLGSTGLTSNLTPNNYLSTDVSKMNKAGYISWYQPLGFWADAANSNSNRTFDLSLDPNATNGLPADASWSNLMNGNAAQTLVFGDDRGQSPSFNVSVSMLDNPLANELEYYWTNPADTNITSKFDLNTAIPVASVTSDTGLPAFIAATNAGQNYTFTMPTDSGVRVKAKNSLLAQNNTQAGTFKYTIADGPMP